MRKVARPVAATHVRARTRAACTLRVCSYEVIHTLTDIFVVMEFVSGGELFDYIVHKGKVWPVHAHLSTHTAHRTCA